MFTGIIEELGTLKNISHGAASAQLTIAAEKVLEDIQIGDSIAVNGVCLTVTHFTTRQFTADVMAETLDKTNLGSLPPGERVNLERALRLQDRLGGHIVSGHIDGVGTIVSLEKQDLATLVTIMAPQAVLRYIIQKGSVAIDGTSLTVVDYQADRFRVSLIPHTAHATVLGAKKVGAKVNLEGDMIGKYIEKMLTLSSDKDKETTMDLGFLAKHGFL